MLQIKALQETDPQWEQVCAYAAACSWKAGPFLAKDMTEHLFTGWERVFAAYINEEIAGYCTLSRKDCIPDVPYSPYIGYMFVDEKIPRQTPEPKAHPMRHGLCRGTGFLKGLSCQRGKRIV